MCTDNDRVGDGPQPPTGRDTLNLTRRVLAVTAGADQYRIWPSVNPVQNGIIGSVEKVLHYAGHCGEVFRSCKDIAVCIQHVVRASLPRLQQMHLDIGLSLGSARGSIGHLAGAARKRVVHDQDRLHGMQRASFWRRREADSEARADRARTVSESVELLEQGLTNGRPRPIEVELDPTFRLG